MERCGLNFLLLIRQGFTPQSCSALQLGAVGTCFLYCVHIYMLIAVSGWRARAYVYVYVYIYAYDAQRVKYWNIILDCVSALWIRQNSGFMSSQIGWSSLLKWLDCGMFFNLQQCWHCFRTAIFNSKLKDTEDVAALKECHYVPRSRRALPSILTLWCCNLSYTVRLTCPLLIH